MGRSSRSPTPSRPRPSSRTSAGGGGGTSGANPRSLAGGSGGPPSHPIEADPTHRASLGRSLGRNDAELAALNKLNASLRTLRAEIVDKYGEGVLLDVGEGLIRLKTGDLGSADGAGGGVDVAVVRVVPGIVAGGRGVGGTSVAAASPGSPAKPFRSGGIGSPVEAETDAASAAAAPPPPTLDGDRFPPDEVPLTEDEEDPALVPLLRSFLLRLKLRRRLLNRLFRRLNRLSRAMDGESVGPPPMPKYGDVRFELREFEEEGKVGEFLERLNRREEARKRVEARRLQEKIDGWKEEGGGDGGGEDNDEEMEDADETRAEEGGEKDEDGKTTAEASDGAAVVKAEAAESSASAPKTEAEASEYDQAQYTKDLSVLIETDVGYDKVITYTAPSSGGGGSPPGATSPSKKPSSGTGSGSGDGDGTPSTPSKSPAKVEDGAHPEQQQQGGEDEGDGVETPSKVTSGGTPSKSDGHHHKSSSGGAHQIKKSVSYVLANEPPPLNAEGESTEDHALMRYGMGIGATHRTMNSRERENDFGRWKADILSRIPDQVTFDELGTARQVFGLEERRKRALEAVSGGGDEKQVEEDTKDMDVDEEKDGDGDYVDEEGGEQKIIKICPKNKKDSDEDKKDADRDSKPDKEKKADRSPAPKKTKFLSLAAVPSFHDQDLRRIRLIHADLVSHSMIETAKAKIAEATNDYNQSFKASTDLHNQKNKIMADIQKAQYAHRVAQNKVRNDHALEVAIARAKWQKRKDAWEAQKRAKAVAGAAGFGAGSGYQAKPARLIAAQNQAGGDVTSAVTSVVDRAIVLSAPKGVAVGTPLTVAASLRPERVTSEVAFTLAHVVDAVASRVGDNGSAGEGVTANDADEAAVFEEFIPPPPTDINAIDPSTGESIIQAHERIENNLKRELNALTTKLTSAEEERKRTWRRMLKVKGEFDPSSSETKGTSRRRGGGGGTALATAPSRPTSSAYSASMQPLRGVATAASVQAQARARAQVQAQAQQAQAQVQAVQAAAAMARVSTAAAATTYNVTQPMAASVTAGAYANSAAGRAAAAAAAVGAPARMESKYSAENIRARKFSDGSIVPATQPKKTADGRFMRPAGRKRKGMDWDDVRGRWVPAPGGVSSEDW